MTQQEFASSIDNAIEQLPLALMKLKDEPVKRGALLYAGELPDTSIFNEWVEKVLWMLENSAVAARNLPTGKFVAMAYKDGYVVISDDLNESLSEDMRRVCSVATYAEFGVNRNSTCLVFTKIPFELSIVFENETCMVFLVGNPAADVVVYSPERLRQIMVQ